MINVKYFYSLFFCFGLHFFCNGQNKQKDIKDIILNFPDSLIEFSILQCDIKRKCDSDNVYSWFKWNEIHSTTGAYFGKLLHGKYTCYYESGAVKTSGDYFFGVKHGLWRFFDLNGEIIGTKKWKKGRQITLSKRTNWFEVILEKVKYLFGKKKELLNNEKT